MSNLRVLHVRVSTARYLPCSSQSGCYSVFYLGTYVKEGCDRQLNNLEHSITRKSNVPAYMIYFVFVPLCDKIMRIRVSALLPYSRFHFPLHVRALSFNVVDHLLMVTYIIDFGLDKTSFKPVLKILETFIVSYLGPRTAIFMATNTFILDFKTAHNF